MITSSIIRCETVGFTSSRIHEKTQMHRAIIWCRRYFGSIFSHSHLICLFSINPILLCSRSVGSSMPDTSFAV
jgi:hypothetical protein